MRLPKYECKTCEFATNSRKNFDIHFKESFHRDAVLEKKRLEEVIKQYE